MGNKNNKINKKIKKFTTPPNLDELPVEIIYKILDELDLSTIFISLHHVCKRFDEILSTYNQYHINFKNISLKNFNIICSYIRPEQIVELTLSDDENSSDLIELFLSKFSLNTFIYLRSITLIKINNEEIMSQILISIADLYSLSNLSSIKIINSEECYSDLFIEILMIVLTKSSLRNIYFDLSYTRTTSNPLPWLEKSSVKHLTFTDSCAVSFIRNVFVCVPYLESLKLDDLDFDEETMATSFPNDQNDSLNSINSDENELDEENNENENRPARIEQYVSINSPNQLKSLILDASSLSMMKLEWLLKEMPLLKHFRLITTMLYDDESILDGQRWKNLTENIEKFEFVMLVTLSVDSKWNIDECIENFRSLFWTEEKKWFVSLEKYDQNIILYTLPYRSNFFVMKNESSEFDYRTTADENSLLRIQSMDNVQDLYIDISTMKKSQFEKIMSPRFPHIKNLYLLGKWQKSKTFFTDLKTILDLNTVEELDRDECLPTMDFIELLKLMPNLQSIKTSTTLLDALNAAKFCYEKCLRSFTIETNSYIEQRSVNIEPFCAMFPRIQNLIIPIDTVESCQYAIEQLNQDLISVNFQIPSSEIIYDDDDHDHDENPTEDLFSEWIKELPKQYRCQRKQQQIHIWLK